MGNCVNKSLPEFKALAAETGINSNVLAAKIGVWQTENNKIGIFPALSELVGLENFTQKVNESIATEQVTEGVNENLKSQKENEEIDQAMNNFLKSIGVKLETVSKIRNKNGKIIDAVAKADMVKRVVQVVNGRASVDTLPEEAAHFFVELLQTDGNPLFTAMMNNIEGYSIYDEVVNDPRYQEAYEGDETKLKKEAVGKLIAQQLVKNLQGKDSPAKMKRANTWFERVMQAIKKFVDLEKQLAEDPRLSAMWQKK